MASRMVLLGIVPVWTDTPPIMTSRSMMATRLWTFAAAMAPFWPAGPLPITTMSYSNTLILRPSIYDATNIGSLTPPGTYTDSLLFSSFAPPAMIRIFRPRYELGRQSPLLARPISAAFLTLLLALPQGPTVGPL